jgi:hypothetical protein
MNTILECYIVSEVVADICCDPEKQNKRVPSEEFLFEQNMK